MSGNLFFGCWIMGRAAPGSSRGHAAKQRAHRSNTVGSFVNLLFFNYLCVVMKFTTLSNLYLLLTQVSRVRIG